MKKIQFSEDEIEMFTRALDEQIIDLRLSQDQRLSDAERRREIGEKITRLDRLERKLEEAEDE